MTVHLQRLWVDRWVQVVDHRLLGVALLLGFLLLEARSLPLWVFSRLNQVHQIEFWDGILGINAHHPAWTLFVWLQLLHLAHILLHQLQIVFRFVTWDTSTEHVHKVLLLGLVVFKSPIRSVLLDWVAVFQLSNSDSNSLVVGVTLWRACQMEKFSLVILRLDDVSLRESTEVFGLLNLLRS